MGIETVIEDVLAQGRSEAEEIHRATLAERERILREAREEGAKLLPLREQLRSFLPRFTENSLPFCQGRAMDFFGF